MRTRSRPSASRARAKRAHGEPVIAYGAGFAASALLSAIVALTRSSSRYISPLSHLTDLCLTASLGIGLGVAITIGRALVDAAGWSKTWRGRAKQAAFAAVHIALAFAALSDVVERAAHLIARYPLSKPLALTLLIAAGSAPSVVAWLTRVASAPPAGSPPSATARSLSRVQRFGAWLVVLGAVVGAVANGRIGASSFVEVHGAIVWLTGVALATLIEPRLRLTRRRAVALQIVCAAVAAFSMVPPSNRVRLLVLRSSTAVGPWTYARLGWTLPSEASKPAPSAAAESPSPTHAIVDGAPIVVLVTVDAMRADALFTDAEGAHANLYRLAHESVAFTHARAAAADTLTSIATMFAGQPRSRLHWSARGDGGLYAEYPDPATPSIARSLETQGIAATSIVGEPFLRGEFAIAGGFGAHDLGAEIVVGGARTPPSVVGRALRDALASAADDQPAFFYAHLGAGPSVRAPTTAEQRDSPSDPVDREIGDLLEAIAAPKLRGRAVLIFTAARGRPLGEHPGISHGLFDEALRVPLLVRVPHVRPHAVGDAVSLLGLPSTVAAIFNTAPPPDASADSWLPLLNTLDATALRGPVIAESRDARALIDGNSKIIADYRRKTIEVFDLTRDPKELTNLYPTGSDDLLRALSSHFGARD